MGIKKAFILLTLLCTLVCCNQQKGTFTDMRDGQKYRTVKIGSTTWMAENLNFKTESSYCYDDADSSCTKYGRLYTWEAAMSACPSGWHLPDIRELANLMVAAGAGLGILDIDTDRYTAITVAGVGKMLKSKEGWECDGSANCNGTDKLGFKALPGGVVIDEFYDVGHYGGWWSATQHGCGWAFHWNMCYDDVDMSTVLTEVSMGYGGGYASHPDGRSVRCVKG